MNAVAPAEPEAETYFDLKRAVRRLQARRWWIAAAVVLSTAAFSSYAFLTAPVYRATTVLVPAGNEQGGLAGSLGGALGSLGGLASLAGVNISATGTETEESLAVLRSREFTEAFIRDKQLLPVLFADAWDPASKNWKNPDEAPTLARAFKYFDKGIRGISQDRRTSLVTVTIDWRDRKQAADWANEMVERLNAEMRARAIAKSSASVGFLEEELKKTPLLGTQEAINRLIEAQIKQRMVANVTREYAFRVVDRALLPDLTDKVRPKRLVLLLVGPLVGLFLGIAAVLGLGWLADLLAGLRS
jgi:uncharacterized protein involved in exopolysaccharide biosynthesis